MASSVDDVSPSAQQEQDAALMLRVAEGDGAACRLLVDRHLRSIMNFAFRMLGDRAEAEDVAQETFLRLWNHAGRWEPRAKLSTWLHHIARNLCVDRLRTRRTVDMSQVPERSDPKLEASSQLEQRQRDQAVQQALAGLAERQQVAISLVYYQGLSNRDAAEVMGVEIDALESLLARGRRTLRKRLREASIDSGSEPSQRKS